MKCPPRPSETTDAPIYYGFDSVGNLLTVQDDTIASANYFTFDRLNRMVVKRTLAGPVYYEFDKTGLKSRLTNAAFNQTYYGYDAAGRLDHAQLLDGTQRAQYYVYDGAGMLVTRAAPLNRVISYYTYDVAGRESQILARDNTGAVISYFAYTRLANGLVLQAQREAGGLDSFGWDQLDRLVSEQQYRPFPGTLIFGMAYAYDAASNRLRKADTENNLPTYYEYDSRNLLTRETLTIGVVAPAIRYYSYDASMRMTRQYTESTAAVPQAFYYSYNQRNMIAGIANQQTDANKPRYFRFNGAGEPVVVRDSEEPALPATYWTFDGWKLLTENQSLHPTAGFTYFRHNESAQSDASLIEISGTVPPPPPVVAPRNGSPTFDDRGSVRRVKGVSPSEIDESFEYDTFGNTISATAGTLLDTRLRFAPQAMIRVGMTSQEFMLTPGGGLWVPRVGVPLVGPWKLSAGFACPCDLLAPSLLLHGGQPPLPGTDLEPGLRPPRPGPTPLPPFVPPAAIPACLLVALLLGLCSIPGSNMPNRWPDTSRMLAVFPKATYQRRTPKGCLVYTLYPRAGGNGNAGNAYADRVFFPIPWDYVVVAPSGEFAQFDGLIFSLADPADIMVGQEAKGNYAFFFNSPTLFDRFLHQDSGWMQMIREREGQLDIAEECEFEVGVWWYVKSNELATFLRPFWLPVVVFHYDV